MKYMYIYLTLCISMILFSKPADAQDSIPEWISHLQINKELPNPFLKNDGFPVKTKNEWITHREELKKNIQLYEYGFMGPPSPVRLIYKHEELLLSSKGERFIKKIYNLTTGPDTSLYFTVNIFTPEKTDKPLPAIIVGDLCWGSQLETLKSTGVINILKRGYLIVEFDRTQFALDEENKFSRLHRYYPNHSWGVLSMWAWGYHRVVDFIETLDFIDTSKIAVTGFSRGGKAALLAGVLDERIAIVNPNCSGTSGAGPIRFVADGGETIEDLVNTRFPYWFCSNFRCFQGKNKYRLPFDQHTLIALIAPRAYFSTNGIRDDWANPQGTAQAHFAAAEVYQVLGVREKIGIKFADTGHNHEIDKWMALIDFADKIFYKKNQEMNFDKVPFQNLRKAYTWKAPEF